MANVNSPENNPQVCPETHLAKSILVTILCCWPFGIPAIVNSVAVSNEFLAGRYDVAVQKSEKANKWCKYSIIAGVVFWVLYIGVIVLLTVLGELE